MTFISSLAIPARALTLADDPEPKVDFATEVRPLLMTRCVSCHGPDKQEGGLRLDSADAARQGGDTGPAIVPGDLDASLLVKAIRFDDPEFQMPPKDRLADSQIATLTRWVGQGATWPAMTTGPTSPNGPTSPIGPAKDDPRNPIRQLFGAERLALWSLAHPRDSLKPHAPAPSLAAETIDPLIASPLADAGIDPAPQADRRTLIRRLHFDLIGLPPSADDVAAFTGDPSPDAYERLVDRLLASPHYGERQARSWLDIVRYADTNGYERDEFRPLIWQYRDYVVRAFNADKPFDRFIREQLAGDELVPDGPPQSADHADARIATGFLRLGQWDSTAAIFQEEDRLRAEMMADVTNTTAAAFLGLTYSCCQCHDHKYDPLSQADHYRLRAFFAGVEPHDDLVVELPDGMAQIDRHNAELDRHIEPLKQQLAALDDKSETDKPRRDELSSQIATLQSQKLKPRVASGATDSGPSPPTTLVLYQGSFLDPRDEVPPGFPSVLEPGPAAVKPPRENSSGRRLALADWIASGDNLWTARVIVNRVWQQHFGVGLVATPNDFGLTGAEPTHPELLDALAVAFVNDGWSIKRLHRAIVTSAAYRRSSHPGPPDATDPSDATGPRLDPDNRWLWRQNPRRLDAETLRDSLLAVSGLLRYHQGGKPIWPKVPDELLHAQPAILEAIEGKDDGRLQGWFTDPDEATDVRSLYLVRKRCLPIPLLQAFDLPDTTVSCARRDTTVVAPQALILLNNPNSLRYAESLADRALASARTHTPPSADQLVTQIFRSALCRDPDADESRLAIDLLDRHAAIHAATPEPQSAGNPADPAANDQIGNSQEANANETVRPPARPNPAYRAAVVDLCRAILNLNEFVYID
jgi:mono/diheme cytochrome c family protein